MEYERINTVQLHGLTLGYRDRVLFTDAGIGFDQPGHHLHQGGFARPIAPHKGHTVAGLNHKVQAVKNGIAAESQRDAG